MGDTHLQELRSALESKGWQLLSQDEGDCYRISAVWRVQRSTRIEPTELLFQGLDDLHVLPIQQSYACEVRDHKEIAIYFGSMRQFRKALPGFVTVLDQLEQDVRRSNV
jgi:hypothetical protein